MRPWIGAIGHAEDDAPLALENRRYLVVHQCAFEHDQRIGGGADPDLAAADPRLQNRMAQAARRPAGIDDRQQQGEVPAAIEVMIVVPADLS
jgi:hypothetical protein